jgi:hypothetical protein
MKTCKTCKEHKSKELFSKSSSSKDSLDIYCKSCRNIMSRKWKKSNKKSITDYNAKYYLDNSDYEKERTAVWLKNNPDKVRKSNRLACKKWAANNKDMVNARAAKRRAIKLKALPKWLTKEELEQIKELYLIAEMFKLYTGEEYHVDHIVPLQGENVCGLHVPWNLQVIPAKENLSKSNKLQEELL